MNGPAWSLWWSQIRSVVRLEMKKTFFARRGLWVYLLAAMPIVIFGGHSLEVRVRQANLQRLAAVHTVTADQIAQIKEGMTTDEVVQKVGSPSVKVQFRGRRILRGAFVFTDGQRRFTVRFTDDRVTSVDTSEVCSLSQDSLIFATVFEFFFLRLSVFFGCVGIFMNLFRGEMLDKSLHFYLLAPLRREVLLAGKFLAGLLASVVIFTTSTAVQLLALGWHLDSNTLSQYLHQNHGYSDVAAYMGVTALACLGYGSVFLVAGLVFRNPIIPAAVMLVWEAANWFLPALLKKISVIFYLQSLCPIVAPPDMDIPPVIRLLISGTAPTPAPIAIASLVGLSLAVLAIASLRVRKLEISYSTD